MSKSISLLFLTNTNILHKNVFKPYFENCEIFMHPKYPQKVDSGLKSYIIKDLVRTQWGDKSIVMATLNLLKTAIQKSESIQWFILCSEDMYPLISYQELADYLRVQTKSIFHVMDDKINKTSQFWALTRQDVQSILDKQEFNPAIFQKIPPKTSFDERYFLNLLKYQNENYEFTNSPFCYVKWIENGGVVAKHPTMFQCLLPIDIETINQNKSCFLRKTNKYFRNLPCPDKPYNVLVVHGTKSPSTYMKFLSDFKSIANIFVLCIKDEISDSDLAKTASQTFFAVWNMVEDAIKNVQSQIPGNLVIVKEEYDLQHLKLTLLNGKEDPAISTNFDTTQMAFRATKKQDAKDNLGLKNEMLDFAIIENDDIHQPFVDNLDMLYHFSDDSKDKLNAYYRLKSKYEQHVQKKESALECVSCKQPGGTLFYQKYSPETGNLLGAKCLAAKPCSLDIIVETKNVIHCHSEMARIKKEITHLKSKIVQQKNNDLYGLTSIEIDSLIDQINDHFTELDEYIFFSQKNDKLVHYENIVERLEKAIFDCINSTDKQFLQNIALRSLYEFTQSDLYNHGYVKYGQLTVCNYFKDQFGNQRNILVQILSNKSGVDKEKTTEILQIVTRLHQLFSALQKYKYTNIDLRTVTSKLKSKPDKNMDDDDQNAKKIEKQKEKEDKKSNDDFFSVFALDKPYTNKHRLTKTDRGTDVNPVFVKWEMGDQGVNIQRFENIIQQKKGKTVKREKGKPRANKTIKKGEMD